MTAGRDRLVQFIAEELARPVSAGAVAVTERVRELYGDAVRAVLLYGSCLRSGDDLEGVLDLYVLVDRYGAAYRNPLLVLTNTLLPPNVFYLETATDGRTVRAKYAVLSLSRLTRSTSPHTFEPYFWARFAQPCALVYAAAPDVARRVAVALAAAVATCIGRGLPLLPERFRLPDLWTATLRETYRSEVRAERSVAPVDLYRAAPQRYAEVSRLALPRLPWTVSVEDVSGETWWTAKVPAWQRRLAPWIWRLRRVHGKVFFLLRIVRNALIFEGGVDYVIWKIERHSGVKVDPSWRKRRLRLLGLGAELLRLYRRGAIR
jgi:hypothetical protein